MTMGWALVKRFRSGIPPGSRDVHHSDLRWLAQSIPLVQKTYYVYIMASQRLVLYVGITCDIGRRVLQHKTHAFGGFTAKYNVTSLAYVERYSSVIQAIRREKELKQWRREKKIALVESSNPKWRDLSYGWYQPARLRALRKSS
jgi:putative endonuclease